MKQCHITWPIGCSLMLEGSAAFWCKLNKHMKVCQSYVFKHSTLALACSSEQLICTQAPGPVLQLKLLDMAPVTVTVCRHTTRAHQSAFNCSLQGQRRMFACGGRGFIAHSGITAAFSCHLPCWHDVKGRHGVKGTKKKRKIWPKFMGERSLSGVDRIERSTFRSSV